MQKLTFKTKKHLNLNYEFQELKKCKIWKHLFPIPATKFNSTTFTITILFFINNYSINGQEGHHTP